jgi:hypothetical protein
MELGIPSPNPIILHTDNKSAIRITNNLVHHERTKHIDVNCHYIQELV